MNAATKETNDTFLKAEKKKCTWQIMFGNFYLFIYEFYECGALMAAIFPCVFISKCLKSHNLKKFKWTFVFSNFIFFLKHKPSLFDNIHI